jgi:colanic acid/amylovoran biosynthesis glycosyltransferase
MHIKLVVNSFPSASETFLFNLVVGLQAKGHKVSVCAMSPSKHQLLYASRLNEWSGEIDIMPFSHSFLNKWLAITLIILKNLRLFQIQKSEYGLRKGLFNTVAIATLLKGTPDIIHFAYSGIGVTYLDIIPVLKDKNIKIITSCRGSAEKVRPIVEPKRKIELQTLFNFCNRIHCVSQDMMNGLIKYGLEPQKSFVNFPSVDINYFKREEPYNAFHNNRVKLITTGRLHFQKGYVLSLLAMKKLIDEGFDFEYKIIGEGPDLHLIQYMISELGLESNVLLTGKVSSVEVKKLLLESDIFILPSLYEGIANAALEALALQLPLITTRSGGMEEVIENNENGIIAERFDANALAEAIKKLIQSQSLRQQISNESRSIIEKVFNLQNQIEIFEKEYQKLITKIRG